MIIDSHCHLNMKDFSPDLSDIIKNAKNNDINGILTISTKIEEFKYYNYQEKYRFFTLLAMGLLFLEYLLRNTLFKSFI